MTNPTYLSDCHNAPVKLTGGMGDFSDHDEVVTMSYICTTCHETCDFHTNEPRENTMSNKPNPETVDEALKLLVGQTLTNVERLRHKELNALEAEQNDEYYRRIAKAKLLEIVKRDIIGENEPNAKTVDLGSENTTPRMERINGRNWFRADQRIAAQRVFGDKA